MKLIHILLIVVGLLGTLVIVLFVNGTNQQALTLDTTLDTKSGEHNLSTSSQEVSMRKLQHQLSQLLSEVAGIKSELQELKNNSSSIKDNVGLLNNNGDDFNPIEVLQQIQNDPVSQANVKSYFQDIKQQTEVVKENFFNDKEFDSEWSSEAVTYLENSIYNNEALTNSGAQLTSSNCKVGICKAEFNIPIADGSSEFDKSVLEHNLLVSISKKFPRSSLSSEMVGSSLVFKGFMTDKNTSLPEVESIFSDGRITQGEVDVINNILGR